MKHRFGGVIDTQDTVESSYEWGSGRKPEGKDARLYCIFIAAANASAADRTMTELGYYALGSARIQVNLQFARKLISHRPAARPASVHRHHQETDRPSPLLIRPSRAYDPGNGFHARQSIKDG